MTEAVTLIGAITALVVAIANAIATLRQGSKLDSVHALVNGQGTRMEILAERTGAAVERTNPSVGNSPTEDRGPTLQTQSLDGESI